MLMKPGKDKKYQNKLCLIVLDNRKISKIS